MTTPTVPPPFTTVINTHGATVCWADIPQISAFIANGCHVYVARRYNSKPRQPQIQIESGIGNKLTLDKLKTYQDSHVPKLLIVAIAENAPRFSHKDMIQIAADRFYNHMLASPKKIAEAARDAAHELVGVYRICQALMKKLSPDCRLDSQILDSDLAGYIGQFASTSASLHEFMKLIFDKHGEGDKRYYEALQGITELDDAEARLGMKCGLESVEIEICLQLHSDSKFPVERMAGAFFAGFFRRLGLWGNKKLAGFATRGADLYEQIRAIEPSLPQVARLIREHTNIRAETPYVYEVVITTGRDEGPCVLYRYHARPDAAADIEAEFKKTYTAINQPLPEISVRQIDNDPEDSFAPDLICLYLAGRFTSTKMHNIPAARIIEELAREITTPDPEFDLDKALVAEPSLYAQVLGAMARAHSVMPRGAVVLFLAKDPKIREAVRPVGLDGMIAFSFGQDLNSKLPKGFWVLSHQKHRDQLLTPPYRGRIDVIWVVERQELRQGVVLIPDEVTKNKYLNNGEALFFLPDKVYRAQVERYRNELAAFPALTNL